MRRLRRWWHEVLRAWHTGRAARHEELADRHDVALRGRRVIMPWVAMKHGHVVAEANTSADLARQLRGGAHR